MAMSELNGFLTAFLFHSAEQILWTPQVFSRHIYNAQWSLVWRNLKKGCRELIFQGQKSEIIVGYRTHWDQLDFSRTVCAKSLMMLYSFLQLFMEEIYRGILVSGWSDNCNIFLKDTRWKIAPVKFCTLEMHGNELPWNWTWSGNWPKRSIKQQQNTPNSRKKKTKKRGKKYLCMTLAQIMWN